MTRRLRAALTALLVGAAVAVMLRLSLWQWHRARDTGRFLNYTYTAEWLLFALLTVAGVVRLVVEDRRRRTEADVPELREAVAVPGAPVPMVGPPLRPGEELEEITWVRLRRRLGLGGR